MARQTFQAWERIFQAKGFDVTKELHSVTATEIKDITGVEPRIMGKMDTTLDVPPIMRDNGYFILPIRNGEYVLIKGNGYHEMEAAPKVEEFESRIKFPLVTAGRGMGEMQYLDYCFNTGVLEAVLGEEPFYTTIRGRERSGSFGFKVGQKNLKIDGVQIEVDLGIESKQSIALVEAKIGEPGDFIIRQLFYPYKRFLELGSSKSIKPVFFTYDPLQTSYNLWVYSFKDPNDYNSIELITRKSFLITSPAALKAAELKRAEKVDEVVPPQADDVEKIIGLTIGAAEGIDTAEKMAQHFQFDKRQSAYYQQASESLGLVFSDGKYHLTEVGREFVSKNRAGRIEMLTELMMDFSLIRIAHDLLVTKGVLTREELEKVVERNSTITGSTIKRRAQTLQSWLGWIGETTGTFEFEKGTFALTQ